VRGQDHARDDEAHRWVGPAVPGGPAGPSTAERRLLLLFLRGLLFLHRFTSFPSHPVGML